VTLERALDLAAKKIWDGEWRITPAGHLMRGDERIDLPERNTLEHPYRVVSVGGRTVYAHRAIFRALFGRIPEGREVDHVDEVRDNNRPTNLWLTTRANNVFKSAVMGGRYVMTAELVRIAKELRAFGFNCTEIAEALHTSERAISAATRSTLDGTAPVKLKLSRWHRGTA
jgi:HNH endonuclease